MTSLLMCVVATLGLERRTFPGVGEVWTTEREVDQQTASLVTDLLREVAGRS